MNFSTAQTESKRRDAKIPRRQWRCTAITREGRICEGVVQTLSGALPYSDRHGGLSSRAAVVSRPCAPAHRCLFAGSRSRTFVLPRRSSPSLPWRPSLLNPAQAISSPLDTTRCQSRRCQWLAAKHQLQISAVYGGASVPQQIDPFVPVHTAPTGRLMTHVLYYSHCNWRLIAVG